MTTLTRAELNALVKLHLGEGFAIRAVKASKKKPRAIKVTQDEAGNFTVAGRPTKYAMHNGVWVSVSTAKDGSPKYRAVASAPIVAALTAAAA
jgi:hypothetical protein